MAKNIPKPATGGNYGERLPKTLGAVNTGRPPKGHDKNGRRLEPHEMKGGKC